LKLNKINELELKEEGLSENQLTDKARKIKSQISDLEAEIVKLENNLAFFKNPSRENPMLRDTYNLSTRKSSSGNFKTKSSQHYCGRIKLFKILKSGAKQFDFAFFIQYAGRILY
jgi:hypothetical protein